MLIVVANIMCVLACTTSDHARFMQHKGKKYISPVDVHVHMNTMCKFIPNEWTGKRNYLNYWMSIIQNKL